MTDDELTALRSLNAGLLSFVQRLILVGSFYPSAIGLDTHGKEGAWGEDLEQEAIALINKAESMAGGLK